MRIFRIFGAAADCNDSPDAIMNRIDAPAFPALPFDDPYSLTQSVIEPYREEDEQSIFFAGRIAPPHRWLAPAITSDQIPELTEENCRRFLEEDGLGRYIDRISEFIAKNIAPDIPVLATCDHTLAAGVISSVPDPANTLVIIFDAHLDIFPERVRNDLVEHQRRILAKQGRQFELPAPSDPIENAFTPGNWVYRMIESGRIKPENLIMVGSLEPISVMPRIKDAPLLEEYYGIHDRFAGEGATFIDAAQFAGKGGRKVFEKALGGHSGKAVYVSLDIDVCYGAGVFASRFVTRGPGVLWTKVIEAARIIRRKIDAGYLEPVGIDISEVEVHQIGMKNDRTPELIEKFLLELFD